MCSYPAQMFSPLLRISNSGWQYFMLLMYHIDIEINNKHEYAGLGFIGLSQPCMGVKPSQCPSLPWGGFWCALPWGTVFEYFLKTILSGVLCIGFDQCLKVCKSIKIHLSIWFTAHKGDIFFRKSDWRTILGNSSSCQEVKKQITFVDWNVRV